MVVDIAGEQGFPKAPPLAQAVQGIFNAATPAPGQCGQGAGMRWQQGFDLLAPLPRQHGSGTTAGYGDLQGAAVHHRRHDKRAVRYIVDTVTQLGGGFGGSEHGVVLCGAIGGGHHQKHARQLGGIKMAADVFQLLCLLPSRQLRRQCGCHHPQPRARLQQHFGLALGHMAAAHQQHRALV